MEQLVRDGSNILLMVEDALQVFRKSLKISKIVAATYHGSSSTYMIIWIWVQIVSMTPYTGMPQPPPCISATSSLAPSKRSGKRTHNRVCSIFTSCTLRIVNAGSPSEKSKWEPLSVIYHQWQSKIALWSAPTLTYQWSGWAISSTSESSQRLCQNWTPT